MASEAQTRDYYVATALLGGSTLILVHTTFREVQSDVTIWACTIIDKMQGCGITDAVRQQLRLTLRVRTRKEFTAWLRKA